MLELMHPEEEIRQAAQTVWDYHLMGQTLEKADLIWALGSHDLRVADRAAELWHSGMAPTIIMSGGLGHFTKGVFDHAEADLFAERAIQLGVPESAIRIENRSSNTGENVRFTRALIEAEGLWARSVIAVQKPYMERRTYATIRAQWPEVEVRVTSPQLGFYEYCNDDIPQDRVIAIMVGDLQRIIEYPSRGFMIDQEVGSEVLHAMQRLIEAGYDQHLLK